MADTTQLAEKILAGVQGYVSRSLAPLFERLKAVEGRQPEKGERGEKGEPGERGADGKDGAQGANGADGRDGADGAPGKDGSNGLDGAAGKDGIDGKDGSPGERGERGEPGEKGERGDPGDRGEPGEAGRNGADGLNGKDGANGEPGLAGERGEKGDVGPAGRDGQDGRDALDIEILEGISPAKRFQRGTVASHRGGLWKAVRPTDLLPEDGDPYEAGWTCIVCGIDEPAIESSENQRSVAIGVRLTTGKVFHKTLHFPVVLDRGIFKADDAGAYEAGDGVTWDGSFWIAQRAVQLGEKPGDASGAWRLAVKRGRDGRDGLRGEKGERGGVLVTKE